MNYAIHLTENDYMTLAYLADCYINEDTNDPNPNIVVTPYYNNMCNTVVIMFVDYYNNIYRVYSCNIDLWIHYKSLVEPIDILDIVHTINNNNICWK